MLILIVGIVVFIAVFVLALINYKGWYSFYENIIFPFLVAATFSAVTTLICLFISFEIPNSAVGEISRTETQLIALKDNMAVEGYRGGRYVYRGYIEEELQYTYLYEASGKGLTSGHCEADKTYINYIKDAEQPKLITVKYGVTHPIWKFFTVNDLSGMSQKTEYYLYVPEGSIVAEGQYEIDLE